MTPRIVRTKYKDLSHTEKWLYTCLKDLCGKRGTCFRTLRSLKEETDISIASLSTMVPKLHAAGLIHAEKKRSPRSGKEIWHISIVDIWQMNKDYCSEIEQSQKEVVQELNEDPEIVQQMNKVVQNTNKATEDCSIPERGCSNFSDIRRYPKNKDTKIDTEEEGTYSGESENAQIGTDVPTPAPQSSDSYSQPQPDMQGGLNGPEASQPDRDSHSHSGVRPGDRAECGERDQTQPRAQAVPASAQNHAPAAAQTAVASVPAQTGGYTQATLTAVVEKPVSAHVEPKAEQDTLIQRPAVPEMPLQTARWCAETALIVSEALRGKYYADNQRKNQQSTATRMFRDFKTLTRPQFEEIFADWVKWWRDHDKGYFTLADLLAKGQNHEVRLQTALDRLEARTSKPAPARPQQKSTPKPDDNPYSLVNMMASRPLPTLPTLGATL